MKFISIIKLDKNEIDKYNVLLDIPSEDDGVINAGYDEDSTIECFTAQFADGHFADIKIYGKLSQNISNALGALGNASINQFVDTISQQKRNKNEKMVNEETWNY